jgi:nitrous oxide reductase accessory protein NosL
MRVILLLIVTVLLSGCATWKAKPVPCPVRPVLESLTMEELSSMDIETMEKIGSNQIRLKEYAKKLEIRAACDR